MKKDFICGFNMAEKKPKPGETGEGFFIVINRIKIYSW